MDDDPGVDSEENVLIYPKIESIYSDVNIKPEPIDIDEEDYESMNVTESSSDYYMPIPNKIIIGTKPPSHGSEPIAGPSNARDGWHVEENYYNCDDCDLAFPTQNELDSHNMTSHSYLVPRPMSRSMQIERERDLRPTSSRSFYDDSSSQKEQIKRRQKAVKSTAKSLLNITFPILQKALRNINSDPYEESSSVTQNVMIEKGNNATDGIICKHCDVRFPNEIALIKHTYELLPDKKFHCDLCQLKFTTKTALKTHWLSHFKKTNDGPPVANETLLQCVYCSCYLMQAIRMKRHLLKNHKVSEFAANFTKFTGKCGICSKPFDSHILSNKHVMNCHHKAFTSKTGIRLDANQKKIKCVPCGKIFVNRSTAYRHRLRKHPGNAGKDIFVTTYDKPVKQISTKIQKVKVEDELKTENIGFIQKQTLFKCNKCQIHFVKCIAASSHSIRCSLTKGDWKCSKCRRTFTNVEKDMHTIQHKFTDNFKVHVVTDRILCKVLYLCPNCEIHFDETAFRGHILTDCVPTKGVECTSCNIQIHPDCMTRHERNHNKFNFSSDDFIIVPFIDTSTKNMSPGRDALIIKQDNDLKQELFYCSTCKSHSYTYKKRSFHLEGSCKLVVRRHCPICGLVFSSKPYIHHMKMDHNAHNLSLDDFTFRKMVNSKVINPVMPDFYQCDECKVRFITPAIRNNHDCWKQMFLKCPQCSEMYDAETYDVHLTYHNYRQPKTGGNSSLKFYSCVTCMYGFLSYDSLVEHCQQHYTNTEALITQPCKHCQLDYTDDHETLHSNGVDFEIYKFDYEKLLTNEWMYGFDGLLKDDVEVIMSRSIYGVLRNVHLELLTEGPAERTLYRCSQCDVTFDEESVVQHTMETCNEGTRFKCGSCVAVFKTRDAKIKHANIHVVYGDDITFREIVFNNVNDKELNEALRTGIPKESLKFRKCQYCELLIKKSDYQKHIAEHKNQFVVNILTGRRGDEFFNYKLYKPINSAKKPYTVYKCRLCNAGIHKRPNVVGHKCAPTESYKKCNKCYICFLPWLHARHVEYHKSNPKYKLKNILVVEFEAFHKPSANKRRRYSSDDDASASSMITVSVPKTYETRGVTGQPFSDNLSENGQDNDEADVPMKASPNTYAKKYIKRTSVVKVGSDQENENISQDTENTDAAKKQSEMQITAFDSTSRMKNKFYQCDKCYSFFDQKLLLLNHFSDCNASESLEKHLICNLCDIVFHPSSIRLHAEAHKLVNMNPAANYFYLTNITTNGVKVINKDRWLYKCKVCDVNFLSGRSIEDHFVSGHKFKQLFDCEICGLKFTKISRTKHVRIQHKFLNMSINDIHIEIIQKKTVNDGKINLTTYMKSGRTSDVEIEEICDVDSQLTEVTTETEGSIEKMSKISFGRHLYQCSICLKHYLTEDSIHGHMRKYSHSSAGVDCNICGLLFGGRILGTHKRIQHNILNFSREDFIISIIKVGETINEPTILNNYDNQSEMLRSANNTDQSQTADDDEEHNDSIHEKYVQLTQELKFLERDNKIIGKRIYKCVECCVFYINRHTLLEHILVRKHRKSQCAKCNICGLVFDSGSLNNHKNLHHETLELKRDDFIITDVFGSEVPDGKDTDDNSSTNTSSKVKGESMKEHKIGHHKPNKLTGDDFITTNVVRSRTLDDKNTSLIDTDGRSFKELEDKEKCENKDVIKAKDKKIFKLYQCMSCRVCVEKSQRNLHVCCSDIQKIQCISCCLLFRNSDVRQHRLLHFKHRELSRQNFALIRFGHRTSKNNRIYKCNACSTHFVNVTSLEWHMDAWNHQTKRAYCKHCGLFFGKNCLSRHIYIHHKKLKLSVENFKIVCVSDVDKTTNNEDTIAETNNCPNIGPVSPNVNISKLFRCIECDVYFLNRASYYKHIYKHKKLDTTEFIDCNICDLQFLVESLGLHMKSHKDKSFYLDKVLIEEYQPNSTDLLSVKTYFGNNLNSKLVSTTTSFENVKDTVLTETDEQLSVIDSTSDGIPKATLVNNANSIHNNICPSNSGSSPEERTLNVEVPNNEDSVKVAK